MDRIDDILEEKLKNYLKTPNNFDEKINDAIELAFQTEKKEENKVFKRKNTFKNVWARIVGFLVASVSVASFAAYAGVQMYNRTKPIEAESYSQIEWIDNTNMSYKIIDNESDYNNIKKAFANMPEVDFQNQFLVIVQPYQMLMDSLELIDTATDDTTTYITLGDSDFGKNEKNNIYTFLLNNDMKRSKIDVKIIPGLDVVSEYGLTPMKDIKEDYFKETAYNEKNCIVLDSEKNILSNNQNLLDEFQKKSEQEHKNSAIRFVEDISNSETTNPNIKKLFRVADVIYHNNEYYYYSVIYEKDLSNGNFTYNSFSSFADGKNVKLVKNNLVLNEYYFMIYTSMHTEKYDELNEINYNTGRYEVVRIKLEY